MFSLDPQRTNLAVENSVIVFYVDSLVKINNVPTLFCTQLPSLCDIIGQITIGNYAR